MIRHPVASEAGSACDVVRRSIQELCVADHQNDASTLAAWLENKTLDFFARLVTAPSKTCVVAVRQDAICGFGHIDQSGYVGLLYVAPEAQFCGVSTLMLNVLEETMGSLGVDVISLSSSLTAKRFYEARGYAQVGEPTKGFGITYGWPMEKRLARTP